MTWDLIVKFLILTTIVSGGIIFVLHRFFISSVDGAKQRLERDAEAARAREAELNRKIRQADDELKSRKQELDALENKMKGELQAEAEKEKEDMINKARGEAEETIIKAQTAAENIRRDIEKEMDLKIASYSSEILDEVLSKKVRAGLEKDLIEEFVSQLREVDMSKLSTEIKSADVVTAFGLKEKDLNDVVEIVRSKTGREIQLNPKTDSDHIAGIILQFGTLQLDGSLKSAIRDMAVELKTRIEKSYQDNK